MGVVYTEWLNKNELRAYPLQTTSARTGLPDNLLADANIWLPASAGQAVYLSSVCISPSLVTLTLLAASFNPFAVGEGESSSSGEVPEFVPLAVLNVPRPVVRFKNYAIQPVYPGVGGWINLGQGAIDTQSLILRFLEAADSCFVDRCVRSYQDLPVRSLGKVNQSLGLTGLVSLSGAKGSMVTRSDTMLIGGNEKTVGVIGLDLSNGAAATLLKYAGTCGHRPQSKTCIVPPITMINNVVPDEDGNINIEFNNHVIVGDVGTGMVLDSQQSLSELCPPISPNGMFINPIPGGYVPPTPPVPPESSSGPEPSSSEGSLTPEYCEEFTGPTNELYPREGAFSIITVGHQNRFQSSSSLGPQLAIDLAREQDAYSLSGYTVRGIITPTDVNYNGFLVVAYQSLNNFFFAGVNLQAWPGYPNGCFFIGKKTSATSGPLPPAGLDFGYSILVNTPAPVPLIITGYSLIVNVAYVPGYPGFYAIAVSASWNDGTFHNVGQVWVFGISQFNRYGYCGLGVVNSVTQFANFGINCTSFPEPSSSSSSEPSD